jgi:hypothetical protein
LHPQVEAGACTVTILLNATHAIDTISATNYDEADDEGVDDDDDDEDNDETDADDEDDDDDDQAEDENDDDDDDDVGTASPCHAHQ